MTLETFFDKFDQFADAPDAVAKMRHLILRLAMQGKLSAPGKSDVPVIDLLREVEQEKRSLGVKSSVKTTSGDPDFSETETSHAIPARWTWVRFGNIARHNAGKTLDKGRNRGELRDYITTSNLYWGFFQLESVRQMPIQDNELERCTAITMEQVSNDLHVLGSDAIPYCRPAGPHTPNRETESPPFQHTVLVSSGGSPGPRDLGMLCKAAPWTQVNHGTGQQ